MDIVIRDAKIEDAQKLLDIYAHYVENTAVSYEYAAPTLAEFQERMRSFSANYPYLLAEENGKILGYAYAHPYGSRAAYRYCAEASIYLSPDACKRGCGRLLYGELEGRLKKQGICNLYALVAYCDAEDEYLSHNSAQFHLHMGFEAVGHSHKCGYKFGRWYDIITMEKFIGEHK